MLAVAGTIQTSTSPLRIGGNTIWSEWFNGLIDEVRVYGRALTSAEIQVDMNTSISSPDTVAPSAPGTLVATDGLGQVSLAWGAATDNVAVARYNVHRGTTAGFVPSAGNRIAQPTGRPSSTPASRPASTTTASRPRTPPAMSAQPATRRAEPQPPTPHHRARRPA